MVDGEDAVEVVHFVLEKFGHWACGVEFVPVALAVLVAEPDAEAALEPDHEVGQGEAVVPDGEFLGALPEPLGVDEFVADAADVAEDDADGGADLDGADAAAEAVGAAKLGEGVFEVLEDFGGGGGIVEGFGDLAEDGVAELEDSFGGHGDRLAEKEPHTVAEARAW